MARAMNLVREWVLPSPSMKRRLWPIAIGVAYVALIYFMGGLRARHVAMASLSLLDAYNFKTRKFLNYFFPFILLGCSYDFMRYFYWQGIDGRVRVAEPYEIEKRLFGIMVDGKLLTPNEYFQIHNWKILDFFCGLAYLTFVFEYLSAGFGMIYHGHYKLLRAFGWCFYLANIAGFITYFVYPASPPWYVALYGLGPAKMNIPSTPAGAGRFDALFGTHFFDVMYGQSVDIHGAIPSLHVAYPLLVAWASFSVKRFRAPALAFYFLMCFSAVYLNHHYIIDVILGTIYAVVALVVVRLIQDRKLFMGDFSIGDGFHKILWGIKK